MKRLYFLGFILFSVSCVSKKYNVDEDQNDFQKIQAGTKYTIFDKNDQKLFLNVTSVEKDSIRGTRKNQLFAIAKNDNKEIRQNRTGATVALVSGGFLTVALIYGLSDITRYVPLDLNFDKN